jgi:hypothetical protein
MGAYGRRFNLSRRVEPHYAVRRPCYAQSFCWLAPEDKPARMTSPSQQFPPLQASVQTAAAS